MKNSLAFLAAPLLLSACAVGDLGFGVSRQAIFSADTPDELVALSACAVGDLGFGVSRQAIFSADTPDELVALGGVRLIDEAITVSLSGGSFVEPNENWIWEINADGTHHARDADGDWADPPGGLWHVVDGMFCRENEDLALKCSEVYKIGPY